MMDLVKMKEIEPKFGKEMDKFYTSKMYERYAHFGDKGYLFPGNIYKTIERSIRSVQIRSDDIWISGFPRSGTHWVSELAWLLSNDLDFNRAREVDHTDRVLFFDFNRKALNATIGEDNKIIKLDVNGHKTYFDALPSPRYFKTHFPMSLLPPGLLDTAKMVYVARDPRDVAVSCYHFYKNHATLKFNGDFKTFWDHFKNDYVIYCPYFANVKEHWKLRDHPNLLFLFYEEMFEDLSKTCRRVAGFLGREYTKEQIHSLTEYLDFNSMKKNKGINYDPMLGDASEEVVRKGKAGGWREEFDNELAEEAEQWIAENLKDSDLKYPSIN